MSKSRNSAPSIRHQVNRVLEGLVWDKEKIDAYKAEHQVDSVKKALRPGGDPTAGLPVILSVRTKACYLQTGTTFFNRARELTGKKLLKDLITPEVIRLTLDTHYIDLMPATNRTVLAALHDEAQVRAVFPESILLARAIIGWGTTGAALAPENLARARDAARAWSARPEGAAAA